MYLSARTFTLLTLLAVCLVPVSIIAQGPPGGAQGPPANTAPSPVQAILPWAYPVAPPNPPGTAPTPPAPDDGKPKRVPGSDVALTAPQIRDLFNPPDWYPNDHPAMPETVAHGRRPDVRACGYCHLPNGQGRPENAGVAGLPAGYIIQQMADYKNGLRKSSEPRMGPPAAMLVIGKNANDAEVKQAAEYFASLKFRPWIKVMETKMVPKTRAAGGMMVEIEGSGAGMEPIGQRVIETPENLERTELRDSKSSFLAYVPMGSIKKGEGLVTTGGSGKTIKCAICHGADLKGIGNVPPLAGRSPSYIARQIYDIQVGNRNGPWTQLMKEAVAKLTPEDIVAIVAYTASRNP
jgi:cytochrome c553